MAEAWFVIGIPAGLFLFGRIAVTLAENRLVALRAPAEEESEAQVPV